MQRSRILFEIMCRYYSFLTRLDSGVTTNGKLVCIGKPIITIRNNSAIHFGTNVTLHSDNITYHINMHSPVKLMADGDNSMITVGSNTRLNGVCVHAKRSIEIGENCLIAANTQIMDTHGHLCLFDNPSCRIHSHDDPKPVIIGDNVWIGAGCYVLPGSHIGEGSIVSASSVVKGVVPEKSIVLGNPASVKQYDKN